MEVDGGQAAAQKPAGRVTHGNRDDFIPHSAHYEQVTLSEEHKGEEHDEHGGFAVAGSSQGTGVNLVKAAQHVEGCDPAQQKSTVLDYFRFGIEERHQGRSKGNQGDHHDNGGGHRDDQGVAHTPLGTGYLTAAQVLAHKGGGSQRDGLHGQKRQLVDLGISSPAGHTVCPEIIHIGLYKDIGKRGDAHLQSSGDAHFHNLFQHIHVNTQFFQMQLDAGISAHQSNEDQDRADALRENGSQGYTGYAHFKYKHEQQVQNGV